MNDNAWPIYSFQPSFPPQKIALVAEPPGPASAGPRLNIVANGTVSPGELKGSVVGFDCRIGPSSVVEDSILFDCVSVGSGA